MNIEEFRQREKAFTVTPEDVVGNTSKDVVGHNNVSFNNQGSYVRVNHSEYDRGAGFDLTDFDNVKNFTEALEDVGIDPYLDYFRVQRGIEYEKTTYLYCWANEDVLIVTGNNPITGAYSNSDERVKEKGYASYIGIEGKEEKLAQTLDSLKEKAKYYKDIDPRGRSFI